MTGEWEERQPPVAAAPPPEGDGEPSRPRRKNGKRNTGDEKVPLDMTSMIDVVFLLLIFFMTATKFHISEGSLRSYLPRDRGMGVSTPTATLGLRVSLHREGASPETQIWLDFKTMVPFGDPVSEYERERGIREPNEAFLQDYLINRKKNYSGFGAKGLPVIIDFEENVPTKYVVEVLNVCKRVDIQDVTIAAPEQKAD